MTQASHSMDGHTEETLEVSVVVMVEFNTKHLIQSLLKRTCPQNLKTVQAVPKNKSGKIWCNTYTFRKKLLKLHWTKCKAVYKSSK